MTSYHENYFILHILFASRIGDHCSFFYYLYRIVRSAVASSNLKRDFGDWSKAFPSVALPSQSFSDMQDTVSIILSAAPGVTDFHTRRINLTPTRIGNCDGVAT